MRYAVNPLGLIISPLWKVAERNETFDGSPRIYLNQGDLKLLHQQLLDAISIEFADYVIRFVST